MQKVFDNPSKLEALVKEKFAFPDFIMMENAALALKKLVLQLAETPRPLCLILCGKGNNGGDGYALARLLSGQLEVLLFCLEAPVAREAQVQYQMCKKIGIKFISQTALFELLDRSKGQPDFIIDCLYGSGFKGQPSPKLQKILTAANKAKSIRIACDIPTALEFKAHYTVTMGEHKIQLFSDKAKEAAGTIILAPLGLDPALFQGLVPDSKVPAFLISVADMKLPLRTDKAAHKGTYGHTAVMAGEKSGAAILCATAAMHFGSGLTSLVRRPSSNLNQFKISPELMISEPDKRGLPVIPAKTSCLVYGPGIEAIRQDDLDLIYSWFSSGKSKSPAAVFDAGLFSSPEFPDFLKRLDKIAGARIVLTPHLLEFTRFCKSLKLFKDLTVQELTDNPQLKIQAGKKINKLFPNTCLVIKSANTFIACRGQIFIVTDGGPCLAKGGSGDILAGMIASLLAQGYSPKDAAISACEAHALAGKNHGSDSYDLTPLKLCR